MQNAALEQALEEIADLVQTENFREASVRCKNLLARDPTQLDALVWLGRAAMGELRWSDAIAAFDRAMRVRVAPKTLGDLGMCYWKLGRLRDAEYCLRGALELDPKLTRVHLGLAIVLHASHRFEESIARLALAERLDPTDHQIPMRRGCALAALGRYDEAQREFARSTELAGRFTYARLIAFDRARFDATAGAEQAVPAPRLELQAMAEQGERRYVALISCNPSYARTFGMPFLRSFAEHHGAAHHLHIHIYDPDTAILDDLKRVAEESMLASYTVTSEESPFATAGPKQRKAYYACGRLVHLPCWLDQYNCPMLSLDADFIVERPLDGLVDAVQRADVGLNLREPVDSPWLDVVANVIVARPTALSRRYFAAVKNYVLNFVRSEPDAWLVDQSALYCVLKMFERYATPPALTWMPAEQLACLWHIGHAYGYRMEDPRYRKYASASNAQHRHRG